MSQLLPELVVLLCEFSHSFLVLGRASTLAAWSVFGSSIAELRDG